MLLRRLYSSLPPRPSAAVAAAPAAASGSARTTRGRTRPVRVALKRRPSTSASSSEEPSHGRRLRRGVLARTDLVSSELPSTIARAPTPQPAVPGFEPVSLHPFQAGLHLGLTPAHMPLPLALGIAGYASPRGFSTPEPFERHAPAAPTTLPTGSALAHHLAVSATPQRAADGTIGALEAARAAHVGAAERAWEAALARLGRPTVPEPVAQATEAEQADLADALAGVQGLLARLSTEEVSLDSVKRKRKKKIRKHKYKKRRKATRAERKRLGK